jgi:SAM-dependent methyltransferase
MNEPSAVALPPPRRAFSGSGPGARARDGCSVELYRALPYLGELEDVRTHWRAGETVLELGCGAGRHTRELLAQGLAVTAVDNAPDMLAALPPGATPVLCDIEQLSLDSRFDIALLASGLVNHPDARVRQAMLSAARRHLRPGGRLYVQRQEAAWLLGVRAGTASAMGPATLVVESVRRTPPRVAMSLRYDLQGRRWRHSFVVEALREEQVEEALARAGFADPRWLDARRRWVCATAPPA